MSFTVTVSPADFNEPSEAGSFTRTRPPQFLRELYSEAEWFHFVSGLRRWLGCPAEEHPERQVLCLDDALLAPSAYTYAVAVKAWMERLGMTAMAGRIAPQKYSDEVAVALGRSSNEQPQER